MGQVRAETAFAVWLAAGPADLLYSLLPQR